MDIKISDNLLSIHRKTKAPIALNTGEEWVASSDYIEWDYTDKDKQKEVTIKYKKLYSDGSIERIKRIVTEDQKILISSLGVVDGVYEWQIKTLGVEAREYSEYSDKVFFRLDSKNPELSSVDIVNVVNSVEYHSNYKEYDLDQHSENNICYDGIYISNNDDLNLCKIKFKVTGNQKLKIRVKIMIPKNDISQNLNNLYNQSIYISNDKIKIVEN